MKLTAAQETMLKEIHNTGNVAGYKGAGIWQTEAALISRGLVKVVYDTPESMGYWQTTDAGRALLE